MSDAKDVKFSLKVMMNTQNTKVLFAEADSAFTDVLLSFLTLPLGKIVRVLEKHYEDEAPAVGSLTTLYKGLSNLDSAHFSAEGAKQMLLDPISWFGEECRKLKCAINDTQPIKYFACEDSNCWPSRVYNIGMYYGVACSCGKTLKKELTVKNAPQASHGDGGGFTKNRATFVISDDLQIWPNVTSPIIQIVKNLGITDTDWGELKNVTFGFDEIMGLLKGLFLSPTPLTDVVLKTGHGRSAMPGFESGFLLHKIEEKATSNSKKMVLKVIVQKSTNTLLFAISEEDMVDFLFSSLVIPLGRVEFLLGGNTCLKNLDNLYMSISSNVIDEKYFKFTDTKNKLTEPKIPHCYLSENQFLPLAEGVGRLYYCREYSPNEEYLSLFNKVGIFCYWIPNLKSPNGYVKGPGMFMVTDDLTVTPMCTASFVSTLKGLNIPLSDVTELVLHIGLEEALSILKASLTSTSALSIGLSPMLMKQSKQEL